MQFSDIIGGGKNLPPPMSDSNFTFNMTNMIPSSPATPWKYNEEEIVKELLEYIRGTYTQHYSAGDQKIQQGGSVKAPTKPRFATHDAFHMCRCSVQARDCKFFFCVYRTVI